MTHSVCTYPGDRDEALVTFLYDDGAPDGGRAAFEAHLAMCGACRDELDTLKGVRGQLGRWNPPEPNFAITFSSTPHPSTLNPQPSAVSSEPSSR